jgi:hypothetical protein
MRHVRERVEIGRSRQRRMIGLLEYVLDRVCGYWRKNRRLPQVCLGCELFWRAKDRPENNGKNEE